MECFEQYCCLNTKIDLRSTGVFAFARNMSTDIFM